MKERQTMQAEEAKMKAENMDLIKQLKIMTGYDEAERNGAIPEERSYYAAYGSNLNVSQMFYRCPNARVIDITWLPDYRLVFMGHDGACVASVEPCAGEKVPIVIWSITESDEEELDRYEGWPRLYRKEIITLSVDDKPEEVMLYIMNETRYGCPNYHYYQVIADGYLDFDLDVDYLEEALHFSASRTEHIALDGTEPSNTNKHDSIL